MRRHVLLCAVGLAGCFDFQGTLQRCRDGGACAADSGTGDSGQSDSGAGGAAGSACYDAFCWENPLPQGNEMRALWGNSVDDVWAAGWGNMLMHWDGTGWTIHQRELDPLDPRGNQRIEGLWGDSTGYLAATQYTHRLLEHVGNGWQASSSAPDVSFGVTGDPATQNLFVTGPSPQLYVRVGGTWSTQTVASSGASGATITFDRGIVASAFGGKVFVCDAGDCANNALAFDGPSTVRGVSLQSGPLVVLTQADGTFEQTAADGGFVSIAPPVFGETFAFAWLPDGGGLLGQGDNALFSYRRSTRSWQPMSLDSAANQDRSWYAIWAAPNLVGSWAAGSGGGLARLEADGGWHLHTRGVDEWLFAATVTREGTLLVGGERNVLLVRDGGSWVRAGTPQAAVYSLRPASDGGAWLAEGSGHLERWTPARGPVRYWDGAANRNLRSVLELPSGALLAGDDQGSIYRLQGAGPTVTVEYTGGGLGVNELDGWDEDQIWAVTDQGYVGARQRDGGWSFTRVMTEDLESLLALPDAGVWACGGSARLFHLGADGGWLSDDVQPIDDGISFNVVRGTSASDLWIGAEGGKVYTFDGTGWSIPETGSRSVISALIVLPGQVWLVGEQGMIIHATR